MQIIHLSAILILQKDNKNKLINAFFKNHSKCKCILTQTFIMTTQFFICSCNKTKYIFMTVTKFYEY